VGVDLGGFDGVVTEEVLDGANIGAGFEEVSGEGVAEAVGGDAFIDLGVAGGLADEALEGSIGDVVATAGAGGGVLRGPFGREEPLPFPGGAGVLVFSGEALGEPDGGEVALAVGSVEGFEALEVFLERGDEAFGKDGDAFLITFTGEDVDLEAGDVDVVDTEAEEFEEAEAGAVHEFGHEAWGAFEVGEEAGGFLAGEDGGEVEFGMGSLEVEVAEVELEGVGEEELEGVEGLALGGWGVVLEGEVGEKGFDVGSGGGGGVLLDEGGVSCGPATVGFFGAPEEVVGAGAGDELRFPLADAGVRGAYGRGVSVWGGGEEPEEGGGAGRVEGGVFGGAGEVGGALIGVAPFKESDDMGAMVPCDGAEVCAMKPFLPVLHAGHEANVGVCLKRRQLAIDKGALTPPKLSVCELRANTERGIPRLTLAVAFPLRTTFPCLFHSLLFTTPCHLSICLTGTTK
jgi:hypothetical protein